MSHTSQLPAKLGDKLTALLVRLREYESCAVAFSAGVDSTVVVKAAHLALGDRAVAMTGSSASLAEGELEQAKELVLQIGIRHVVFDTNEVADPNYQRNASNRCFFCKSELYTAMRAQASRLGLKVLVNGANADDVGDHRPGMVAANDQDVRSPLLECGITKEETRQLAAFWHLPVWDKPATPCLSSRIAYGEQVTPEKLRMIDLAEQFLRGHGLREVRVRYHQGDLARIEVPPEAVGQLCQGEIRVALLQHFSELGFKFVTIDLAGFRSGSLNALVPVDQLKLLSE